MRNKYCRNNYNFDLHLRLDIQPECLTIEAARGAPVFMCDLPVQDGSLFDPSLEGRAISIHPPFVLPLEAFRRRREWKEVSVWTVVFSQPASKPEGLINLFAEAFPARWSPGQIAVVHGRPTHVHIQVPFSDSDFSGMSYRVFLPSADSALFASEPFGLVTLQQISTTPMEDLPNLAISGPDSMVPDELAVFEVMPSFLGEPTSRKLSVELESVNGYLPKSRIDLRGPGVFRIRALDLEPGDTMKIKAGFRYRPSVAEKEVRII